MSRQSLTGLTKKAAIEIAGSLSEPEKMPGFSYGLPPAECKTGAKLAEIPGTPCHVCYAKKGFYKVFEATVTPSQYRHLNAINHPLWEQAMIELIGRECRRIQVYFFRWQDAGDLQSVGHLYRIVQIARALPKIKFWLPTQEYAFVAEYRRLYGEFPVNLVVRLSAHKINGPHPSGFGLPTSGVHSGDKPAEGIHECPARYQDNFCGKCRACWDRTIPAVSYHEH